MPASSATPRKIAIGAIERIAELAEPDESELGAMIYGTKSEKWACILKAENEIAKEEAAVETGRSAQPEQ
eukprot:8470771-Heterocapsa_arctica.AAC.1